MTDPLGLISQSQGPLSPASPAGKADPNAPGFADALKANLAQVNKLQQEATEAIEDLASGRRDDVETVLISVQKSDEAFKLLQALRNKVVDAYQEIQQMRV